MTRQKLKMESPQKIKAFGWRCRRNGDVVIWHHKTPPSPSLLFSLILDDALGLLLTSLPFFFLSFFIAAIYGFLHYSVHDTLKQLIGWMFEPVLWVTLIGLLVFGVASAISFYANSSATSFEFDLRNEKISYSESMFGLKSRKKTINFSNIISIRPYISCPYDTMSNSETGTFHIEATNERGKSFTLHLGDSIPINELRRDCSWLRQALNNRVQETLQFDNSC